MTEAKCAAVPAVPACLDTSLCAEPEVSPHMRRIQGREYQAAVLL
jgi:hypothetical protein